MKKFFALFVAALLFVAVTDSHAQKAFKNPMYLGGEVGISMPLGDFGDGVNMGFGLNATFQYYFQRNMSIVGFLGYWSYGTDSDDLTISNIPFGAGFRYEFAGGNIVPFIGGDLCFNNATIKYDSEYGEWDDSELKFGFAPAGGIIVKMSPNMDLVGTARFNIISDMNNFQITGGLRFRM